MFNTISISTSYRKSLWHNESELQRLMNKHQLAKRLGISVKFVEKWAPTGRLPGAIRIGRSWRFNPIEIEKQLITGKLLIDAG